MRTGSFMICAVFCSALTAQSLQVVGPNSYFDAPSNAATSFSGDITVEAWIRIDVYPSSPAEIVNKKQRAPWQGFTLHIQNGFLEFATHPGTSNLNYANASTPWTAIPLGQWTHVAGVASGSEVRVVVNGVTMAVAPAPAGPMTGSANNPLRIGLDSEAPSFNPDTGFTGLIDEVRLWSIARTDSEIQSTLHVEIDGVGGLVSAWHLNGTADDLTGGNHGTLAGAAAFQSCPHSPISFSPSVAVSPGGPTGPFAVVWPLSSGGNGHAYEPVAAPCGIDWYTAHMAALAAGGHLVSITTVDENNFVFGLINSPAYWQVGSILGPWIGAFEPQSSATPAGWRWVTNEPFTSFIVGGCGSPNNNCNSSPPQPEDFACFCHGPAPVGSFPLTATPGWNDLPAYGCGGGLPVAYVVEYDLSLTCAPPTGAAFTLCAAHNASGDARLQVFNVPANTLFGKTLISTTPATPVGTGSFFGLNADLFTLIVLLQPYGVGDPLSWTTGEPGIFPDAPHLFPPGLMLQFAGSTWDLVAVALTSTGGVHFSNFVQNTW